MQAESEINGVRNETRKEQEISNALHEKLSKAKGFTCLDRNWVCSYGYWACECWREDVDFREINYVAAHKD